MSVVQALLDNVSAPVGATNAAVARRACHIRVEIADAAQFQAVQDAWADLLLRADAPNVFMDPAFLRFAQETSPDRRHRVLLGWRAVEGRQQLAGVCAFSIEKLRRSVLPKRVVMVPPHRYAMCGTPVIDRTCLDETLSAMLDAIVDAPDLPYVVAFNDMAVDSATHVALERVLRQRGTRPHIFVQFQRPKLQSALDGKTYLEKALSSSTRKKLRQHRRRLSDMGALTTTKTTTPDQVRRLFDDFLTMEAAGWKGRQGTAWLCNQSDAAFVRGTVAALAERGAASIYALRLNGKPISLQLVLRAGPVLSTWRTTYDEAFSGFSPGILLFEDYTAAFLADKTISYVDSNSLETSWMGAWTERQRIADLWIDARPGGSFTFRALSPFQRAYRDLRTAVKRAYLALRKPRHR